MSGLCVQLMLAYQGEFTRDQKFLVWVKGSFAFGKAGEVLTVSFPPKVLPSFLDQSGAAPRACSC